MSTNSLEMPPEGPSAGLPSRCRESARRDAEVAVEDRLPERPLAGVQPGDVGTDLDVEKAGKANKCKDLPRVMSKQAGDKAIASEFTSSFGCKSSSALPR